MRTLFVVAAAFVTALTFFGSAPSASQQGFGQPIYPGYQGFLDNPDGSVTMVFQYFSHGRDAVEIPVGPRNRFTGTADRNQPTTFRPGNHEFVCVIIVENREAARKLRWTVAFPEAESATSLDPLNPEYMLVERGQTEAQRALDVETAPRGVCVNKPPRALSNSRNFRREPGDEIEEIEVAVGEAVELRGIASDEGLPRGGSFTASWTQISGPADAELEDASTPRSFVTFPVAGTYELELSASDGETEASDRIRYLAR